MASKSTKAANKKASAGQSKNLCSKLKEARTKQRITLRDLASRVGVGAGFINRIETGTKHPTPSLLLRMLAELGFGESEFQKMLNVDSSEDKFAEQFVATVFERQGFKVITKDFECGVKIAIGGGWNITLNAQLQHKSV